MELRQSDRELNAEAVREMSPNRHAQNNMSAEHGIHNLVAVGKEYHVVLAFHTPLLVWLNQIFGSAL